MKVLELLAKHKALEELSRPGSIGVGNRKTMFWIGIFCRYTPSEDKGLETASLINGIWFHVSLMHNLISRSIFILALGTLV